MLMRRIWSKSVMAVRSFLAELIDGVLDKGVSGQLDYIHRPDYRSVKIQDSRLRLVSGWDSPLCGRQVGDPDIMFPSL